MLQATPTQQISQELLDALDRAFPQPSITRDSDEATIKWAAAQNEVVRWIKARVNKAQSVYPDTSQTESHLNTPSECSPASRPRPNIRYGQ